jgi:hypothetical protein
MKKFNPLLLVLLTSDLTAYNSFLIGGPYISIPFHLAYIYIFCYRWSKNYHSYRHISFPLCFYKICVFYTQEPR